MDGLTLEWLKEHRAEVRFFLHRWQDLHDDWREEPRVRIKVGMQLFEGTEFLEVLAMARRAGADGASGT